MLIPGSGPVSPAHYLLFFSGALVSNRQQADVSASADMSISFWIIFNAGILVLLFLDLAVWNRGSGAIPFKKALASSAIWIALALGFAVFIHQWMGPTKSL